MKNVAQSRKAMVAISILVVAALSRLTPHIPNFAPMESLTLLSGVYIIGRYLAFALPILVWWICDLILNNTILRAYYPDHEGFVWFANYMPAIALSAVAIVLLGKLNQGKVKLLPIAGSVLGSVLIFFLITNFGSWMSDPMYPKNATGILASYTAGLPFLQSSLMSNVIFSAVAFTAIEGVGYYFGKSRTTVETQRS